MASNGTAQSFKALHKTGDPVILTNVYDLLSAEAVAALPDSKALATASYAVARAAGSTDDDMTLETNLAAVKLIAKAASAAKKPLTVDIQDGYGPQLEEAINALIDVGVVGINLEDVDKATQAFHSKEEAASRIQRVLAVAKSRNVPDFVINARCDTLVKGGTLDETIERGRAYLAAGATTVFVWGGSARGVGKDEVAKLVEAFDGRLNVSLKINGGLSIGELKKLGVQRISIGPALQFHAMAAYADAAAALLKQ